MKHIIKQFLLRHRFGRYNNLWGKIEISKDFVIGKNCTILDGVKIGRAVILHDNCHIGRNVFLENIEVGNNTTIESGVVCTGYGKGRIRIGENCYVGINNVLDWSNDIIIGDYVHIAGPSTGLWTHTSAPMCLNSIPLNYKDEKFRPTAPIVIENNVYIGGNCTIYPGVTIGKYSIVAPNSAVTKNVPSYKMVGGVPASEIKSINQETNNQYSR
ncbi:MAG: DapH/DapD/GlmU-related protein [Ignavibacteria bacterium]